MIELPWWGLALLTVVLYGAGWWRGYCSYKNHEADVWAERDRYRDTLLWVKRVRPDDGGLQSALAFLSHPRA